MLFQDKFGYCIAKKKKVVLSENKKLESEPDGFGWSHCFATSLLILRKLITLLIPDVSSWWWENNAFPNTKNEKQKKLSATKLTLKIISIKMIACRDSRPENDYEVKIEGK